jgi:hypothetical protein
MTCKLIILVIILVIILIGLLLYLKKIYEKFEEDESESIDINMDYSQKEVNIVDCTKYPVLCSNKKNNIPYEPYMERRAISLNRLKNISKRFNPSDY